MTDIPQTCDRHKGRPIRYRRSSFLRRLFATLPRRVVVNAGGKFALCTQVCSTTRT